MNGPVIVAGKAALEKKDITPVLKWVKPDAEAEIQAAFAKTLAVRVKDTEARELADRFFFETVVRLHRAGEGAPFTGLKPAGSDLGPAIEEADIALGSGSADKVVKLVTDEVATGIHRRFAEVREKRKYAEHNVQAGRDFVAAYVDYVHYVEGLYHAARCTGIHHSESHEAATTTDAHGELELQHKH